MKSDSIKEKIKEMGVPLLTSTGENMLAMQASLSGAFRYSPLPEEVRSQAHSKYISTLPKGFEVAREYDHLAPDIRGMASPTDLGGAYKPGYEIFPEEAFPLYSREGTLIAEKFSRIVVGDYGAFVEIDQEDMAMENTKVKEGQEYRIDDEKYSKNVKYQWFTTKDDSDCKLYFQQKGVTYADYKPDKWYVSPYEVLDREELKQLGLYKAKDTKEEKSMRNEKEPEKLHTEEHEPVFPKPSGYKTVNQWAKEGRCPVSDDVVEEFSATKKDGTVLLRDENGPQERWNTYVYQYVAPENTEPIKKAEKQAEIPFDMEGKKVVCFDTETTGLSKWDEILQITMSGNEGVLLDTYIKPQKRKSWPQASEVNHIYPETVADAPSAREVAKQVKAIIRDADIIVGHNIPFDIRMVEQCMGIKFHGKTIVDTLDLFKADRPEGKHKLRDAVEYYCPEIMEEFEKGAHRADTDTWATLKVFNAIAEKQRSRQAEEEREI